MNIYLTKNNKNRAIALLRKYYINNVLAIEKIEDCMIRDRHRIRIHFQTTIFDNDKYKYRVVDYPYKMWNKVK